MNPTALGACQQVAQQGLAAVQLGVPQVPAVEVDQIEREVDQCPGLLLTQSLLQPGKRADPGRRERDDLAVEKCCRGGERADRRGDLREPARPVVSLASPKLDFPMFESGEQAVAVELDLVQPVVAGGHPSSQLRERGRKQARQFPWLSRCEPLDLG